MSEYEIYLGAIELMSQSIGLRVEPMTELDFNRARVESDFVHSSVIDMDAFESAFGE